MSLILPILATLAGVGASLVTLVFLAACAPNSTPRQLAFLKRLMWGAIAAAALGIAGATVAMIDARPLLGAAIGLAPAAGCILLLAWLYAIEG